MYSMKEINELLLTTWLSLPQVLFRPAPHLHHWHRMRGASHVWERVALVILRAMFSLLEFVPPICIMWGWCLAGFQVCKDVCLLWLLKVCEDVCLTVLFLLCSELPVPFHCFYYWTVFDDTSRWSSTRCVKVCVLFYLPIMNCDKLCSGRTNGIPCQVLHYVISSKTLSCIMTVRYM